MQLDREKPIVIRSCGSVSGLGLDADSIAQSFYNLKSNFQVKDLEQGSYACVPIAYQTESKLKNILHLHKQLKNVDRSVLLAIYAANQALDFADWGNDFRKIAVNIGSSRGATALWEEIHAEYQKDKRHRISNLTSPLTTLGNISSWVAQILKLNGAAFSHSITCSTSLYALANAVAWIKAGMADRFLVGGAEAPLTDFTFAQLESLKLYSKLNFEQFPCRPLQDFEKANLKAQNSLILGEGACVFAIESLQDPKDRNYLAKVQALGFANESIENPTAISENGLALQEAMHMALKQLSADQEIDLIIMHAPGTVAGDRAELNAIVQVFGDKIPQLFPNKWLLGHTFGASAALSIETALLALKYQQLPKVPYPNLFGDNNPKKIERVMVNSIGFGGNAACVVLQK